jgi:hypothetical protein
MKDNLPELKATLYLIAKILSQGMVFTQTTTGDKATPYRAMAEYGTWILEFETLKSLGF